MSGLVVVWLVLIPAWAGLTWVLCARRWRTAGYSASAIWAAVALAGVFWPVFAVGTYLLVVYQWLLFWRSRG